MPASWNHFTMCWTAFCQLIINECCIVLFIEVIVIFMNFGYTGLLIFLFRVNCIYFALPSIVSNTAFLLQNVICWMWWFWYCSKDRLRVGGQRWLLRRRRRRVDCCRRRHWCRWCTVWWRRGWGKGWNWTSSCVAWKEESKTDSTGELHVYIQLHKPVCHRFSPALYCLNVSSVCLSSVTCVYCDKADEAKIMRFSVKYTRLSQCLMS